MPKIVLTTPADVAAAAAAWLGFVPTNSVVVYMLRRHPTDGLRAHAAIRFDVTATTGQAANFPATCNLRAANYDAAILLAVCDPHRDSHTLAVLDALRDALTADAIPVQRRVMTHDVTVAGQWFDPDSGQFGPTYPYTDSVWAAQRIRAGHPISPSRADIQAEFAPSEPAPPVAIGEHAQFVLATNQQIAETLTAAPIKSRTLATRAAILITGHVALRDAMIGLAIDRPQAGADLWTLIARQLRNEPRAQALTVAAACFCFLGDGIRAAIAVEAAINEADPTDTALPVLAEMLHAALRAGLPPAQIAHAITAALEPKPRPDK